MHWAQLAQLRGVSAELKQGDMLAPDPVQIATRPTLIASEPAEVEQRVTFRRLF
jgi:hypothetical protein